jgi:hypothetical protein
MTAAGQPKRAMIAPTAKAVGAFFVPADLAEMAPAL